MVVREFDPRPPHCPSVGTGMDDRLRPGMPSQYVTSHLGQLSFLLPVGREMTSGQSAVMRCGRGVKAGWLSAFVDKRVGGGRQNCVIPLTRAILCALEVSSQEKALYKCPVLNLFFFKTVGEQ